MVCWKDVENYVLVNCHSILLFIICLSRCSPQRNFPLNNEFHESSWNYRKLSFLGNWQVIIFSAGGEEIWNRSTRTIGSRSHPNYLWQIDFCVRKRKKGLNMVCEEFFHSSMKKVSEFFSYWIRVSSYIPLWNVWLSLKQASILEFSLIIR